MKKIRLGCCIAFCLLTLHQAAFSQRLELCSEEVNGHRCFVSSETIGSDGRDSGERANTQTVYTAVPKISVNPLLQQYISSNENRSSLNQVVSPKNNSSIIGFDGINNRNTRTRPDISADVSRKYYVQAVNASIAVYNKQGTVVATPVDLNTLWDGFGGVCESKNGGHPAVVYDDMADRWVIIQPAENGTSDRQCVAVSMTGNPTGYYYLYDFPYAGGDGVNDEPKISVGEKAYYTSGTDVHPLFRVSRSYAIAYERSQLLNGLPARQVTFKADNILSITPMRVDGKKIPAEDYEQLYMLGVNSQIPITGERKKITINRLIVNWTDVSKSSFSTVKSIDITPWKATLRASQPNNTTLFVNYDIAPDFVYNGLSNRDSLVYSHSIASTDSVLSSPEIRWYEFNVTKNDIGIRQQGNYKPDASSYWLSNAALDTKGNLALGYSVSSNVVFPSIGVASRLVDDPLSTLTATAKVKVGEGAQKGSSDWGKDSDLKLDPDDDCTFWLSNQYYKAADNDTNKWSTYIANFKLGQCTAQYTAKVMGKVRNSTDSAPIEGALVTIGNTFSYTDKNGDYKIDLPAGDYRGQASAYGFKPFKIANFKLVDDEEATLNIELSVAKREALTGRIYDKKDNLRNLYAKLSVTGPGGAGFSGFTHPETGEFSLPLVDGLKAQVIPTVVESPDYFDPSFPTMLTGASSATHNFPLSVKSGCNALGYSKVSGSCQPVNGSFVAGYVVDQYGDRLSDIKLKNQAGSLLATSRTTPEDMALGDGFLYGFIPASAATGLTLSGSTIVTKDVTASQIKLATPIVVQSLKPVLDSINDVPITVVKGKSVKVPISLKSVGGAPVAFQFMDTVNWLSFSPSLGSIDPGKTQTVMLTVDSTTMTADAASLATVIVKTNGDPVRFTVSVFVTREDAPVLAQIGDVSVSTMIGKTAKTKVVLESIGKKTVNFSMGADVSWLSFSPTSGSIASGRNREVELTVDASTLPLGVSTAKVTAKTNGKPVSFTLSVIVLPASGSQDISLSLVRGEVKKTMTSVTNNGSASLSFSVTTGVPWLTVTPAKGTIEAKKSQTLTLAVDSSSMPLGISRTKVIVKAGGFPAEFSVSATVTPPIGPDLAPIGDVSLSVVKGNTVRGQIIAKNIGQSEANFTIISSAAWLTFNPVAARIEAGKSQQVTLAVDSTNMPVGTSVAKVTANSGGNTVTFNVKVEVTAVPTPKLDSISDVTVPVVQEKTAQASVTLKNIGTAKVSFTATSSASWLTFTPATGNIEVGKSLSANLSVNSAGLELGSHTAQVTLNTNGNLVSFKVTAIVVQAPVAILETVSSLDLDVVKGNTARVVLPLKNIGLAPLDFKISTSAPWLSFNPSSGTIGIGKTQDVTLVVDSTDMSIGRSEAEVSVDVGGQSARLTVAVHVTEQASGTLSFSYNEITARTLEPIPNLVVSRTDETSLAASVDYSITVDGVEIFTGRLSWAAGEGGGRSITVPPRTTPATIMISFSNPVNVTLPRDKVTIKVEAIHIFDSLTSGGSMGGFWVFMLLALCIRRSFCKSKA